MTTPATPNLAQVLQQARDAHAAGIHTALPGRIESFDASKQRANVQPLLKRGFTKSDDSRGVERLPVVTNVPVVFAGSGANTITWPISVGDVCLLVFAEGSLDRWLFLGGDECDPQDDRRHTLTDGIAICGLRAAPLSSGAYDPEAITVTGPRVVINSSDIRLGGSDASKRLVTVDDFNGHTHGPGTFTNSGGDVTGASAGASNVDGTSTTTAE
jgi:hypothetical protein